MKKEVKLIIFDLDGTLYNLNDVVAINYQMQLDFYMEYTKKDLNETVLKFEENNIFPEKRIRGAIFTNNSKVLCDTACLLFIYSALKRSSRY